jgi:peptidoglycan hydrolase CwlO-like protein
MDEKNLDNVTTFRTRRAGQITELQAKIDQYQKLINEYKVDLTKSDEQLKEIIAKAQAVLGGVVINVPTGTLKTKGN